MVSLTSESFHTLHINKVLIELEFLKEVIQWLSSEDDTLFDEHQLQLLMAVKAAFQFFLLELK